MSWPLIKNYWKKMYRSSSRMILTLFGLILAVVILMLGMIVCETFLEAQQEYLAPYRASNGVLVDAKKNAEVYKYFKSNEEYNVGLEISDGKMYKFAEIRSELKTTEVYGNAVFVDENMNLSMTRTDRYESSRYSSKLLKGRLINQEDIAQEKRVMVISEALAVVLFDKEDPIGKEVKFWVTSEDGLESVYERFEIVGVIASSKADKEKIKDMKKLLSGDETLNEAEAQIFEFNFYAPYSIKLLNKTVEETQNMTLVFTDTEKNYRDITSSIRDCSRTEIDMDIDWITNADTMYSQNAEAIKNTQNIMLFAVLLIFIISGVSITNTMLFSVKERINEIGIRKAIGAFNSDIVGQFIFEGFVYGVLSSIIGIFISVAIASHAFLLLNGTLFTVDKLVISKEAIILSMAAAVLVGVLASIIPAIYSSKIKVADALRFE
jgi:putative ABC transport system permease protein